MTGFAVVGLGMGRTRARQVGETEGAEWRAVVDLNEELAAKLGRRWDANGVPIWMMCWAAAMSMWSL